LSQPIITPGKWLNRDALPPEVEGCALAVVGFCRFNDMKTRLAAEPLSESLFSHLDVSHQFVARVADKKILALECLYGGPLSATVIEELAHYGIKTDVGYGYAGSLTRSLPVGQIALADVSIVSDGTSREYLSEVELVYPDGTLADCLREVAGQANIPIRGVTVWTTDALYREYPCKVAAWRKIGADVVNMDTSHFYAVGRVVGMSVVYLCVVSDCVEGPVWDDGFARVRRAMSDLQSLVLEVIVKVSGGIRVNPAPRPSSAVRGKCFT
jgi:purine-nucleoside phosphorylase